MNITLEDINTWEYLFGQEYTRIEIPLNNIITEKTIRTEDYALYYTKQTNDRYWLIIGLRFDVGGPAYLIDDEGTITRWMPLNYGSGPLSGWFYWEFPPADYTPVKAVFYVGLEGEISSSRWEPVSPLKGYQFNEELFKLYINTLIPGVETLETVMGNTLPIKEDEVGQYVEISSRYEQIYWTDPRLSKEKANIRLTKLYTPPEIIPSVPLMVGCNNKFEEVINCPVDFKVYYQNKEITELYIPRDINKRSIRVRIITKSSYPYLPSDTWVDIDIAEKVLRYPDDLQNYDYLNVFNRYEWDEEDVIVIDDHLTLVNTAMQQGTLFNCTIINNTNLNCEGVSFKNVRIINNGVLSIKNGTHAWSSEELEIVNNNQLNMDNVVLRASRIINNGQLILIDSTIYVNGNSKSLPFVHSSNNNWIIQGNKILTDAQTTGSDLAFIRANDIPLLSLHQDNQFECNAELTVDSILHNIRGNGFVYMNIDDDTLHIYNMEMS